MDKITETSYKICLYNPWPVYWQNYIISFENVIGFLEREKRIIKDLHEQHNGRFYLKDDQLESLDILEYTYGVGTEGIVFENTEDALAFILKWS